MPGILVAGVDIGSTSAKAVMFRNGKVICGPILPTVERIKAAIPYITKQNPDAIIINSNVGSKNLPGGEKLLKDLIRDELGIPTLFIEATPPLENIEIVEYKIRAFMEMN